MTDPGLERLEEIPDPIGALPSAPQELPRGLAERLRETRAPTRSEWTRRRALALLAAVGSGAGWLAALGVRPDVGTLPSTYVVAWVALPLLLGVIALASSVRPGRSGVGHPVLVMRVLLVALPIVVGALALVLPEPPTVAAAPSFFRALAACFNATVLVALLPILLAALALRHGFAAGARLRGALLGAAAGLFATTVLNAHCPLVDQLHLVLGHALPVAVAATIGALAAQRFMRA